MLWYPNMLVYVFLCSLQEMSITICDVPDTVKGSLKAETYFMDLLPCFDNWWRRMGGSCEGTHAVCWNRWGDQVFPEP